MKPREVLQRVRAAATSDGAGVKINRVMVDPKLMDPFVMIDEINSGDRGDFAAGFPSHPHRGFETITYMRQGGFAHRDSMGNEGKIGGGGVQWMTAGRGVIHSEMPLPEAQHLHGFQLWLNLPAAEKMRAPAYRDIATDEIPEVAFEHGKIRVIAGTINNALGPIRDRQTSPILIDVQLSAGHLAVPVPPQANLWLYVYEGELMVQDDVIATGQAAHLSDGDCVDLRSERNAGALLLGGQALQEPVVQHGPFVMNTHEQIQQAMRDYRDGRLAVQID